jgi:hypothetical protein
MSDDHVGMYRKDMRVGITSSLVDAESALQVGWDNSQAACHVACRLCAAILVDAESALQGVLFAGDYTLVVIHARFSCSTVGALTSG